MPKFLVDESSGIRLFEYLIKTGYDCKFVGEIMPGCSDLEVLNLANQEKRIIITNDKDFGFLAYKSKKKSHGIILLRLSNESIKNKIKYLDYVLKNYKNKIELKFIVVEDNRLRFREL